MLKVIIQLLFFSLTVGCSQQQNTLGIKPPGVPERTNRDKGDSCQNIIESKNELRASFFTHIQSDSCAQDTDCVGGKPGDYANSSEGLNVTSAQANEKALSAFFASPELATLENKYKALNCISPLGLPQPPVIFSAKCEKNKCVNSRVVSCDVSKGQNPSRHSCKQYTGLTSSQMDKVEQSCRTSGNQLVGVWKDYTSCDGPDDVLGYCEFKAKADDAGYVEYFYGPGYSLADAQAACAAGDGVHGSGVWKK